MRIVFVLALVVLCRSCSDHATTKAPGVNDRLIGAFNIQVFGRTKAGKPDVMNVLCQILKRYDIVLIQEIRDSTGSAIVELLNQLNAEPDVNNTYAMEIGPRPGRTNSKEQYCYFYRTSKFELVFSYTYSDPEDIFEREPLQALFKDTDSLKEFVLSGLHASPQYAVAELDYLPIVYDDIISNMGTQSVLFLGDFEADCSYVPTHQWPNISLRNDERFTWYIQDNGDTTVAPSRCAYDRFVAAGEVDNFIRSPGAYDFKTAHWLTYRFAKSVSDHYPIEVTLSYEV